MKNLLAAVDFSKATAAVISQSAILAKALDAKLWILHVTSNETQAMVFESVQYSGFGQEPVSMLGDVQMARNLTAEEIRREHSELLSLSSRLREEGINTQALLLAGDAARLILDKASELDADIIILGSHGHGLLHKALLGSVSESVTQHADRNVMIVPAIKI
jgi:nucleotide-binding universal stress UspA family protein